MKAATVAEATDDRLEQQTLQARDAAQDDVRYSYISAADGFTADAVAAGYPKIADRVRPTARRRAGLPEPTDLEEPEPVNPDPTLVTDPTSET